MRVVALFRVSTERQQNEGASLDAQQRRYRELAASMGWETVEEFRGQESATKAASEREVLQRVLACIREQPVSALWVYEQSRLTRGDELEVALLTRELREREVRVLVGTTEHDLADPSQSFLFGLQSQVDRYEVQRFRERVSRGKGEKARAGKKVCGKSAYGYTNPPPGHPLRGTLQTHPNEAPVIRRIFADVAAGRGFRVIAAALNQEGVPSPRGGWGKTSIRNMVNNPVYLGQAVAGAWKRQGSGLYKRDPSGCLVVANAHEPLVSRELWEAAHAMCHSATSPTPGMLSGLLHIDGKVAVIGHSARRAYYRPKEGRGRWVPVKEVNALAWDGFIGILRHPAALSALLRRAAGAEGPRGAETRLLDLAARRDRLTAKAARYVDALGDGTISREIYRVKAAETAAQIANVDREAADIKGRVQALQGGAIERAVQALAAVIGNRLSEAQKRRALRSVIAGFEIEVGPGPGATGKAAGRFEAGVPRWAIVNARLKLRCTGADPTCWDLDRCLATVPIVLDGKRLEPVVALRLARAA